jgi:hypothetical protein
VYSRIFWLILKQWFNLRKIGLFQGNQSGGNYMRYQSIITKAYGVVATLVVANSLIGCATPKVQITLVQPPAVADALRLKRIAVTEFGGKSPDTSAFVRDVENLLTSINIQGKPYFDVVPASRTYSVLNSKRGTKNLSNPSVVRSLGSSLNVDGILSGQVIRSDVIESPYQENRSNCVRSQVRYNRKGKPVGEICVRWANVRVNCIKREAIFEFSPRLINVSTNQTTFSNTLQGVASDQLCSDSGRPAIDSVSLKTQARNDVLEQIRVALAPVESHVAAEIMEDSWLNGAFAEPIRSPASEEKFASGVQFAKSGRMDRACEIWKALEPIESTYVPLLYNIGVCEESAGQLESARDYFVHADKLAKAPEKRISVALARIGEQISSSNILTKARPDIFFRSKQARNVDQDQKLYGYTAPTSGSEVKIRNITTVPEIVKTGDTLTISMDFSVMAPSGTQDVNVRETMTLKKDGKVLKQLFDESKTQSVGGRVSEADFKIPNGMPAGTYVIEQKVQAGSSYDVRSTVFVVGS